MIAKEELMKHGFANTIQGRLHYLEQGSGQPLVLLHSNGASAFQYEEVMAGFAARWRVLALDMPGHGDSDRITAHTSIEKYAQAVVAFLDALKIDRAAVAGDSVGGSICLALSRDHGKRMQAVVVSETPLRTSADWEKTWPRIEATYSQPTQDLDELKPRFRNATPELLKRWNTDRNKAGAWAMVDVMWAMQEFDHHGALKALKAPTAVMMGAKGNVVSNRGPYDDAVGKANVAVLPECGHFPMIDDPALFIEEVNRLIDAVAS
jgi:magnesium chelatase accessory protein